MQQAAEDRAATTFKGINVMLFLDQMVSEGRHMTPECPGTSAETGLCDKENKAKLT